MCNLDIETLRRSRNRVVTLQSVLAEVAQKTDYDYDRVLSFGVSAASVAENLDEAAAEFLSSDPSASRIDIVGGFLAGYWVNDRRSESLSQQTIESVLSSMESASELDEDAATSIASAAILGLMRSKAIDKEDRRQLALRLDHFVNSEPAVVSSEDAIDIRKLAGLPSRTLFG